MLTLSLLSLFIGPAILFLITKKNIHLITLEAFIISSVTGLVIFHILPECIEYNGIISLFVAILGLASPIYLEKMVHKNSHLKHSFLSLAFFGLMSHSVLDGLALISCIGNNQNENQLVLGLAVILHRIPEGTAICHFTKYKENKILSIITLTAVSISTLVGYYFGMKLLSYISESTLIYFQAFMSGLLLHIIFHQEDNSSLFNYNKKFISGIILGGMLVIYLSNWQLILI